MPIGAVLLSRLMFSLQPSLNTIFRLDMIRCFRRFPVYFNSKYIFYLLLSCNLSAEGLCLSLEVPRMCCPHLKSNLCFMLKCQHRSVLSLVSAFVHVWDHDPKSGFAKTTFAQSLIPRSTFFLSQDDGKMCRSTSIAQPDL